MTRQQMMVLGGGGVVVVAIAAAILVEQPARESRRAVAKPVAGVDPIAALQRDVAVLTARIERQSIHRSPSGEPQAVDTSAPAAAEPGAQPATPITPAQITEMLETHHADEPVDRAWSDKLHADLRAALVARSASTTVSSTQCTTSLCKVSLLHDTVESQRRLGLDVADLAALGTGTFYHYDEGAEPPHTVLYVAREGYDLVDMVATR